jgi:hypothetical protein
MNHQAGTNLRNLFGSVHGTPPEKKVGFYLNAEKPVFATLKAHAIQEVIHDPVSASIDMLIELAQKHGAADGSRKGNGIIHGGYDGFSYHLNGVDSVFIELPGHKPAYLNVTARQIRNHLRSDAALFDADAVKLLKTTFPRIFKLGQVKPSDTTFIADIRIFTDPAPIITDGFSG